MSEGRKFTRVGAISIFSVAILWCMPAAFGQSAAGAQAPTQPAAPSAAAKTADAGGAGTQSAEQKPANAPADYQMQDQSAPPADSLAEAARRAKAQKPKSAAPKVYTDDSVTHLSGHGVSVVGDSNSGGSGDGQDFVSDQAAAAPQAGASQEQYWRGRARTIHDQMAQIDRQIDGLRAEIAKQGAVSVDPQSGFSAGVIYITDRNAQIKELEGRKDGLQRQMDTLEDEGRKAGADSGWFR
ncbi:MAG TPA: hypothetical protein VGD60_15825 [Candidatus Acidoferrales bacterium]